MSVDWSALVDSARARRGPNNAMSMPSIVQHVTGGAYHHRYHLDDLTKLLTDAVEDVRRGKSRFIVVSMPPGQGKSVTCSVALPLYVLAQHPTWNAAVVSSELSLATKFSRDARREAEDVGVQLAPDSGQVTEWETTAGGGLLARGVGGSLTGRRVKVLVIDDPIKNAQQAYSEVEREALWQWYLKVARTRLAPASLALLVMTRWHEDDLAGKLLKAGWEEFRLPALAETDDPIDRAVGEPLLTPQAEETIAEALVRWAKEREEVGEHTWAGLYQQRPAPAGGSIFNTDDLLAVEEPIDLEAGTWVTSWDLGFGTTDRKRKAKTDYSVGTVWQSLPDGRYILHDVVRGRWEFTEQLSTMRRTIARYPQCSRHLVEAAANGAAIIDTMRKDAPGVPSIPGVTPIKVAGAGKVERWQACTPLMEAHKVYHMGGAWLDALVAEMAVAPNGTHDDQLDSFAQALNWLRVHRARAAEVNKTTVATRLPGR